MHGIDIASEEIRVRHRQTFAYNIKDSDLGLRNEPKNDAIQYPTATERRLFTVNSGAEQTDCLSSLDDLTPWCAGTGFSGKRECR